MYRTLSIKLFCRTWKEVAVGYFGVLSRNLHVILKIFGDRGSTVVKVLCYKSEGH